MHGTSEPTSDNSFINLLLGITFDNFNITLTVLVVSYASVRSTSAMTFYFFSHKAFFNRRSEGEKMLNCASVLLKSLLVLMEK